MQIASAICVMYVQLKSFGFSVNPQRSGTPSDTEGKSEESLATFIILNLWSVPTLHI